MKAALLLLLASKFSGVFLTGGTMLFSMITYAWVYGWTYAVGLVGLIFVHEMGHYIAARQRGILVGPPTFIPFVGAWIELKDKPHNAETEAYIGFAGPLTGSCAALLCYFIARHGGDAKVWMPIAYAGFFINLFNLIPLHPFDGGRITAVVSPKLWLLGIPVLLLAFYYHPSPLLFFMAILAMPKLIESWRGKAETQEQKEYYSIGLEDRVQYAVFYIGLAVFLAMMTHDVYQMI